MSAIRTKLRCCNAADIFLSYYKPLDGSENPRRRRHIVWETVTGDLSFWRAVFAELVALFLFVLLAAGSSVSWAGSPAASNLHISLSFGLVIALLVHCFGDVSGAHLNPAVTIPLVVYREISVIRGLLFIVAQCLGAYMGAALLRVATPFYAQNTSSLGCTLLGGDVTVVQGFVVELVATFQLVFTVFSTTDPRRKDTRIPAAFAVGVSVAIGLLFAIPFTGASMNPARSFGPALSAQNWANHWIYWTAPVVGGLTAGTVYRFIFAAHLIKKTDYNTVNEPDSFYNNTATELGAVGERLAHTSRTELNNNADEMGSGSLYSTEV